MAESDETLEKKTLDLIDIDDRDYFRAAVKATKEVLTEDGLRLALYQGVRIAVGILPFMATLVTLRMATREGQGDFSAGPLDFLAKLIEPSAPLDEQSSTLERALHPVIAPVQDFAARNKLAARHAETGFAFAVFNMFSDLLQRVDQAVHMEGTASEKLAFVGHGLARELAVEMPATLVGATMLVTGQALGRELEHNHGLPGLAADAVANGVAFDAYLRVRAGSKQAINGVIDWIADHWPGHEVVEKPEQVKKHKKTLRERLTDFAVDELTTIAAFVMYKGGQRALFNEGIALKAQGDPQGVNWMTDVRPELNGGYAETWKKLFSVGSMAFEPFYAVATSLAVKEAIRGRIDQATDSLYSRLNARDVLLSPS